MAASAGSPPASWRAWRRSTSRRYGYGIRYANGMFRQEIADGWQVELPEDLARPRQSVGIRAARARLSRSASAARSSRSPRRTARLERHVWKPAETRAGRRLSTRRSSAGAATASTRCGCGRAHADRPDPARRLQRRRPHRRAGREQQGRGADARALSGRFDAGRAGTAAAAGVFLLLGLAAGHRPAPSAAVSATCARCPTRRRSSSTTPIRRSRSPS